MLLQVFDFTVPKRVLAAAVVGVLFGTPGAEARASAWTAPQTIAYEGAGADAQTDFVQSPNRKRTELVTRRGRTGIELYSWDGARFGRPVRVPDSRRAESGVVAINDRGAVAVAWTEPFAYGDRGVPCKCAVRAIVRQSNGHFGPLTEVVAPSWSNPYATAAAISPQGRASFLWQTAAGELHFVETDSTGRFGRSEIVARGDGLSLRSTGAQPMVTYELFSEPSGLPRASFYTTRPPFRHPVLLASLPPAISADLVIGSTVLSDARGTILIAYTTEEQTIDSVLRPVGGSFGTPNVIVHLPPSPDVHTSCELNGAMNARSEALVAWGCAPSASESEHDFGQAALLDGNGRLRSLSPRLEPALDVTPGVAFDDRGGALIAWQSGGPGDPWGGYVSVAARHGRFGRAQTILRDPTDGKEAVRVAVTAEGRGLATWSDQARDGVERIRVAEARFPL